MYSSCLTKYVTLTFIFVNLVLTLPIYNPATDQGLRTILPRSVPGSDSTMNPLENAQAIVNMQKGLSPAGETGAEVAASIGRPPDGDSGVREAAERGIRMELPLSCGQVLNQCIAEAYDKGSANPGGAAAVKAGLDAYINAPQPITTPRQGAPPGSTGVGADQYMNLGRPAGSKLAAGGGDDAVSATSASTLLHALAPAPGA